MLEMLKLGEDVKQEVEKDSVGGGGVLNSDIYTCTIKAAYFDYAKSKAVSLNLILETSTGRKLTQTEFITSGEAKGCKPYYEKNGEKFPLPGYAKMNTLCLLATGLPIDQLTAEDKILKLYDYESKKETNQTKKVITELTGKVIKVGVFKTIVDKKLKNDNFNPDLPESATNARYALTGETREENLIDKFFNEEGATLEEHTTKKEPIFFEEWIKAHQGKVKDKSTKTPAGTQAGAPKLGNSAATSPLSFS
jgi:hypothetical protein